jgi:hypothetical protein
MHAHVMVDRQTCRFAGIFALAVLAAGLTGCSGDGAASVAPAGGCVAVSDRLLAQIAVGISPGVTLALNSGAAVKARKGVYVVAVRFSATNGTPAVGVWTVTSLTGVAAPILVADETASARSTWSTVQEFPQYGVPLDSPSITAARDCLEG